MMKKEHEMIDALLHEHARKGSEDDAGFITSLDERLDAEGMMPVKTKQGSRVGLAAGIAAVLAVSGVVFYGWQEEQKSDVAMNDVYEVEVLSSHASHSKKKEKGASLSSRPADQPEAVVRPGGVSPARKLPASPPPTSTSRVIPQARQVFPPKDFRAVREEGNDFSREVGGVLGRKQRVFGRGLRNGYDWGDGGGGNHDAVKIKRRSRNIYGSLKDNVFKSPWKAPLSTFSVDVDTASYTNVRRMIQSGQVVPADAVRIEEMVNYFSYAYPQPEGDHPFSVNVETASCPWNPEHRIVKIGLQGKAVMREERPAANLVFLLDVSGSMNSQDKLPLLVDSMKILLKELNADDSVSIVVYAGAQGLALPPTYVDAEGRKTILKSLANMRSGGSTNGGAGIALAYKVAKKHFVKGGVNRVILGTDGDFNVGLTGRSSLVSMVGREAASGVFLSVLGFGQGNLNDAMLEDITNKGNGNYYYIDNLREGRKVFLDDMMGTMVTIAKDVKIQVEFNPAKVQSYRLIGYANRMLKAEDFKNKRIDAGEIGAGHTVTALYEIVPGNAAQVASVDGLKYQKNKAQSKSVKREVVDSPEMLTVKLAYKQPTATKETESTYFNTAVIDGGGNWKAASEDFKFASSVGLFGMLQRNSKHVGQGGYALVRELAEAGRGKDVKGLRTEFSDLVRKVGR